MDRSKGFFITVICFVYFVICVLAVVYFFLTNFSFFSLDYNTPVSFLGSYVSKSGVRLFPYYLLSYIMPPLYKR